jgi:bifunctional N-acetylglucosamine-1-phosphate-uridyltransferase/glucosamine-1-phosphate-acetyltransferase GlmU-like protein
MSDTQHGRRRRVSLARLDETVVENALRDAAQIDGANARAESAELEADVAKWRTRAHTLAGVLERIANDPTSKREDVQAIVNTTLGRMDWR